MEIIVKRRNKTCVSTRYFFPQDVPVLLLNEQITYLYENSVIKYG